MFSVDEDGFASAETYDGLKARGGGTLEVREGPVCVRLILDLALTSVRCLKSMGFASTGALFRTLPIPIFMRRLETLP